MDNQATAKAPASSRTKSIAMVGLSIALIAVGSWVTIPIGPIPFTLQMLVIPMVICILRPTQSIAAIYGFVVLGAIGIPLFSGMRGGIGVLLGPTGGFLLGYLVGVPVAALFLYLINRIAKGRAASIACGAVAGLIFTAVSYTFGVMQYSMVAGISPEAAFAVAAAPFIIPDIAKVVIAAFCAQPAKAALQAG